MLLEEKSSRETPSVAGELSEAAISNVPQSGEANVIKRRIRVGEKYHHVTNAIRKELIQRVEKAGEKIIQVAQELKIKYSTAKSILKVYRLEGRVRKIPRNKRHFLLRNDMDNEKKESSARKPRVPKKPNLSQVLNPSNENASYQGPQTRARVSKNRGIVKSETNPGDKENSISNSKNKAEDEVYIEPPLEKKTMKNLPSETDPEVTRKMKNEGEMESTLTKKEVPLESEQENQNYSQNIQSMILQQKQQLLLNSLPRFANPYVINFLPPPLYQPYLSMYELMRRQRLLSNLHSFS